MLLVSSRAEGADSSSHPFTDKEAGDLIQAGLQDLPSLGSRLELAKSDASPSIDTSAAVSVFKSVGVGAQDAAIAQLVYSIALGRKAGVQVDL